MNAIFTTPPRPFDVTALLPQLAPLASTATRLHPRPGTPTVYDSSVGHLVMLGRARWWGGTGSGAALTLAVLLLYGWVAAGLVSLTVVVLVGVA
ncbi:hypothetical protein GT039_22685, partial [Streptomyces sp. SID2955]|nr:hypothetical protein [Streptomyces sp. SID2955]